MKLTFNTGRLYTKEGQIITAEWDYAECKITFMDHSRMICGEFTHSATIDELERLQNEPIKFARLVMGHYDKHKYQMSFNMPERGKKPFQFKL